MFKNGISVINTIYNLLYYYYKNNIKIIYIFYPCINISMTETLLVLI